MAEIVLSDTQRDFLARSTAGLNLAVGAVRSGKTYSQLLRFLAFLINEADPNVQCLITAKTKDVIERNLFDELKKIIRNEGMEAAFHFKTKPYRVSYLPKNIECYCEGANDEGAEGKILGMTAQCWVGDEVNLYPERVFKQCITRLSAGKRVAFLTCNPDRITHFINTQFVSTGRMASWNFKLTDNPTLDPMYIDTIKSMYSGVQFTRYVEGEWGGDEDSLVVPEFGRVKDRVVKEIPRPKAYRPMMALDIGFRDFTFGVFGYYHFDLNLVIIEDELVIKRKVNTDIIAAEIKEKEMFLWGRHAHSRYTDINLQMIEDLGTLHGLTLIPTQKDDKNAQINKLCALMGREKIIIAPQCKELISHLECAVWNKYRTSYERTEEHGHFDGVDALAYFVRNMDTRNPHLKWGNGESFQTHFSVSDILPDQERISIPSLTSGRMNRIIKEGHSLNYFRKNDQEEPKGGLSWRQRYW